MTAILNHPLWLKAGRAGFVIIWLGGVVALASTVLAGFAPVYQLVPLV